MAQFQKGQSGNPGGRPKAIVAVRDLARKQTRSAIETLVKVMDDGDAPHAARVSAAVALLDRGWGKPTQPIAGDDDMAPVKMQRIERVIVDPRSNPVLASCAPATAT